MENLSIKILDALFDLCEGENYVILDKEDIVAPFPEYSFETDELTEILESLTVEGFIDLKYADNTSYCVAMRTKGRTLIKQSREKLQHILSEEQPLAANVIEAEVGAAPSESSSDEPAPVRTAIPPRPQQRKVRRMPVTGNESEEEDAGVVPTLADGHFSDSGKLSRGFQKPETEEEVEHKAKMRDRRTFLAALIGAVAGSLVMDLIFLIILLVILKG